MWSSVNFFIKRGWMWVSVALLGFVCSCREVCDIFLTGCGLIWVSMDFLIKCG